MGRVITALLFFIASSVYCEQPHPSPRAFSAIFAPDRNTVYISMGWDRQRWFDDVWRFDILTEHWQGISPEGYRPSPREGMAFCYDEQKRVLCIFGGCRGYVHLNDWVEYDLSIKRWQVDINFNLSVGFLPSTRSNASLLCLGNQRYLVGLGFNFQGRYLGDWYLKQRTPDNWRILFTGKKPSARYGQVAIYDKKRNRVVLWGGYNWLGFLDDLWVFDLDNWHWRRLSNKGTPPPAMSFAAGAIDEKRDCLVIFGGVKDGEVFDDVFELALDDMVWKRVTKPGAKARNGHSACYLPGRGATFFGGRTEDKRYLCDLWLWRGEESGWQRLGK